MQGTHRCSLAEAGMWGKAFERGAGTQWLKDLHVRAFKNY
jgi:hypothetical protein